MANNLLANIDSEIRAGLQNERGRLDDARANLEFYAGDFTRYPPRPIPGRADSVPRTSLLMQRIVTTLTANLYRRGPTRKLTAPKGSAETPYKAATQWLEQCYRANSMDALWHRADSLSTAADFAGFQVSTTSDPAKPVRIQLWRANELVIWVDPDDQLKPVAVATLDLYDNQRRLRLWTDEVCRTYLTDKWNQLAPSGATEYKFQNEKDHNYGCIPFSFVHFNYPSVEFYTPGIGNYLRSANEGVNFGLTRGFDAVTFNLVPILIYKNVSSSWVVPNQIRPGDIWNLPGIGDGEDGVADPSAEYLQADSSFIAAGWDDLRSYIDHVLEMIGIPPNTIRMEMTGGMSGIAIISEQIPVILWAEGRQNPYASYEDDLAQLVLKIGAGHLGRQDYGEYKATAAQLETVAREPGLTLHWPNMYPRVPGPAQDDADQWRLDNKMASRTTLLMEREQLTREEAQKRLEEIAEDLEREAELFEQDEPEPEPGTGTNPDNKIVDPNDDGGGSGDPTADDTDEEEQEEDDGGETY